MLRKHQREFKEIIDGIIHGSSVRKIYLHVLPGGGKSAIPILAGRLISAGLADALCWIAPRLTLCNQAETNFLDPFFREMLGHKLSIRSATNEVNPCRDQNGFVTTYQAIGMDEKHTVSRDFSTKRYILILDEFHHVEEGGPWEKALEPLINKAAYLVFLSGTLERGDGEKIAFMPYIKTDEGFEPCLKQSEDTSCIFYDREDALKERAILPLKFFLSDGYVEWESRDGSKISKMLSKGKYKTGEAIYTALETAFAEELLQKGLSHWHSYREENPRSRLLVVTANISHARKFNRILRGWGLNSEVATSQDNKKAIETIKAFKAGKIDILTSVCMVYEGFDCKPLTHIISLTHIRSTPWILQEISRAVRVDPHAGPYETQCGFIFAPDDILMREVVERIQAEQLAVVPDKIPRAERAKSKGNGKAGPDIIPIGSRMTGHRELDFTPNRPIRTIKETEEDVLSKIENHVRAFTWKYRYKPGRINSEIKAAFGGKPRREMGLGQLINVLDYVKYTYPLERTDTPQIQGVSKPRGSGRRVPTQAVLWEG